MKQTSLESYEKFWKRVGENIRFKPSDRHCRGYYGRTTILGLYFYYMLMEQFNLNVLDIPKAHFYSEWYTYFPVPSISPEIHERFQLDIRPLENSPVVPSIP